MKTHRRIIYICLLALLTVGCSGVEKLLRSNDYEKKYEAALEYYNNNSYSKAIQLFENLSIYYRGKELSENILWYYAQSLFKEKDYYTASYQFRRFAKQYPYSDRAEEALFLAAYCQYSDSPAYTLDQTATKAAIADFEQYVERFPNSPHIPEINSYLDELRGKLMHKDYDIAYGYFHIEAYHAAYVSFQSFLNTYPDSPYREDAMFYMLRSGYEYAINSTKEKKEERLKQVVNDFERFSGSFSNSKHIKQAQQIYTRTRAALSEIEG